MTAVEVQKMMIFAVGLTVLMVSFIPECILITHDDFKNAPVSLKIYTVIHIGIIIAIALYMNWIRPSSVYLGI